MKPYALPLYSVAAFLLAACSAQPEPATRLTPVDFSKVRITDGFWSPRLEKHASATLPVCIDQIENQTGRMRNFENAANGQGVHSGIFFDDSDVYKALEGMAYSLINTPDAALEAKCDEWIAKIAAAQQPDGYINTYYTLTGLERWDDMDKHEMYCAGHLTEAAVAYYKATGKRTLLDAAIRMADYMMTLFGEGGRHWVPGHEEIELALVKLAAVTEDPKYLDFAEWLLDQRGHGHGTFGKLKEREWPAHYYQDAVPVGELSDISGHAVRSMYLYCGMADVAAAKGRTDYLDALHRLWDDVCLRNMYITGGIGQSASNEGFTTDYSLPNKTAYCETCASVGMVLWNSRMNALTGNGKYVDVLERSMYNGALAGVSLDGERFFYVNPLESDGDHHRKAWYGCACCPSQISRFLPSIGNYIYATSSDALWVNLFIGNEASFDFCGRQFGIKMTTGYPYGGDVTLTLGANLRKELRIRVPAWSPNNVFAINGREITPLMDKGYAVISRKLRKGDVVTVSMDISPTLVAADPRVREDEGMRALQCGPLVYCAERIDNETAYDTFALSDSTLLEASASDILGGVNIVTATNPDGSTLRYIPYYAWDNRTPTPMKVWVRYGTGIDIQ
ncbi:MAG: glycoside hydrolase family 127 protein [Bacteroidales bacterium]|nr:glycoside hydrolase family 127 protein [Bacteroidales bacterium]